MPLLGVKCVLGHVPMDQHRTCMITQPGPPCGIEPTILEMITGTNKEREESGVVFSPSSLSACHRQTVLMRGHDYFIDVKAAYKTIRGSIIHQGLGSEPPYPGVLGVVRELRMQAPISTKNGERIFHGKPDLVVLNSLETSAEVVTYEDHGMKRIAVTMEPTVKLHVKLVDYKTKSAVGHDLVSPDREHVYQINEYAWLVQQFLPGYLNACTGHGDPGACVAPNEHLFFSPSVTTWPRIDEVVVDELSITYMDMSRTRTFTSKGFLYDKGKMLSDKINGRWVRRRPVEYEELELEPIHHFKSKTIESVIRKGIEEKEEAETLLAGPLVGEEAEIKCPNCSVRQICYDLGRQEGYSMEDQAKYVVVGDEVNEE
jgi:hypothetical protein